MRASRVPLLFFAAATALLLWNYPWLSLFSTARLLLGLPPLVLYLFGLWLGFILVVRLLLRPHADEVDEPPPAPPPRQGHGDVE